MPENLKPLSLMEAAAEFSSAPQPRLDDRGFRVDDDDDTPEAAPSREREVRAPRDKIQSLVGDDDLDSDENPITEQDDSTDEDVVDDDVEATDSEDQDAPDVATIDPPKSFTQDEIAEFRKLPPEVQNTLVRRESERDRAVMQRMNQVAEERQQLQPLAQRLQQEQQNFLKMSELAFSLGVPEAKEYEGINWLELSRTDPTSYVEKRARYDDLQQRVNLMANHVQQARQQQMTQQQQVHQNVLVDQTEKMYKAMPELRDQTKAAAVLSEINQTMQSYGFSSDELNQIVDHRIVKAMADLAKLKNAERTKQAVQNKRSASPAPKVMTPNGSADRTANKNVQSKQAWDKLSKTGDIWDAVRVMNLQ